ncbi:MAG: CHAT domain-containing protein [Bacteroidia bacterium]|nr:CHAT domain-containing protein [Bacteroidia bacterium]
MNRLYLIVAIVVLTAQTTAILSQEWRRLDSLRMFFEEKSSFDTALIYAEKALQKVAEEFGKDDTAYANMLRIIGDVCYHLLQYDKTIEYFLQEKEIREKIQGKNHSDYAETLNNLGYFYSLTGEYEKAESLYIESKNITKQVFGENDPEYALTLNNLAELYRAMGIYTKAELLLVEAKNIRKETLGEKHPFFAISLNNLAGLYCQTGRFEEAASLYIDVINIYKETLGQGHHSYATALNNLAAVYYYTGDYNKAEPLLIEAKNITKEALGEEHPDYATSLNNLAQLYKDIGNLKKAEFLLLEAVNIDKKIYGVMHPGYALSINNLALLYKEMNEYSLAEPLFNEAKNIRKKVLGEMHPGYAESLQSLAELYRIMGNSSIDLEVRADMLSKADSLYAEVENILKNTVGKEHPDYVTFLNNLALLYKLMGKYTKAEQLFTEAKNIHKETLCEKHPHYASLLYNLAGLYEDMRNYTKAEPLFIEGIEVINYNLLQNFTFLSETEKELYFNTIRGYFEGFNSFAIKWKTERPAIVNNVYDNTIKNKGLLLKSSTAMRNAILSSNDTALITLYDTWISLKKEISQLYSTAKDKRIKDPKELEEQANELEKELVKGSRLFSDFAEVQKITWQDVQKGLKPNEAAIEFIHFRYYDKDWTDTSLYCALIVKPESIYPEMLRLFNENQLEEILGKFSGNNFNYITHIYGKKKENRGELYELIWKPMEESLKNIKTVYISPAGLLHKVSFSALSTGKELYLCDNYDIRLQSSTGKVALKEDFLFGSEMTAVVFGVINYDTDSVGSGIWKYLESTKTETEKVKTLLEKGKVKVTYFKGSEATEEEFKMTASSSNIMHIASHGFFFPNPEEVKKKKEKPAEYTETSGGYNRGFGIESFIINKNPLMRSGLVFAGANDVWCKEKQAEKEDGVLTAQEVAHTDMRKTQLVVMSACETGLGDIRGSEGVYGLQRAFKMAGVKFLVMSLWQVPDAETEEFMTMFYTKLLQIKDIRKAFNEAQAEMRKNYDPYYWGAFVLIE